MKKKKTLKQSIPILVNLLQRFSPYLYQQKSLIIIAFFSIIIDVLLRIIEPLPIKVVFDYVLTENKIKPIFLENISPLGLLTISAFSLLFLTVLRAFFAYGSITSLAIVSSRVMTQIRNELYCHLQRLSLTYHHQARSGDLVVRVTSDANRLQEILLTATLPLIVSILTLLTTTVAMFWIDVNLTLLALLTLPLFHLTANRLSEKIQESSLSQRQREGMVAATAAEAIGSIKLIQALSLENVFADIFSRQNQASFEKSVATQQLSATLERGIDALIALGVALVLWYGSYLVLQDALTAGDVIVFLTYLKNAFKPIQNFAKYTSRLAKASASGERILNILEEIPEIQDSPSAIVAPVFRGDIQFENVCFAYPHRPQILHNFNLTVKSGQFVAITGVSGSGKSTLMSLLLRLYNPNSGRILIDGKDIRDFTLASVRSQFSVVLQETLLFGATIRENITYGIENVTEEELISAVRLANIDTFIHSLPQGYNTILGEKGATLSGGQRQRLAIARAAIRQTPILILDEPTTGLDKENELLVIEALQKLAKNRTTFLITHDLSFASLADVVISLQHGINVKFRV